MGPLSISLFIVSGIFLTVGLLHLAIYLRRKVEPTDMYFALMCLFAAGGSVLEGLTYTVTAVPLLYWDSTPRPFGFG